MKRIVLSLLSVALFLSVNALYAQNTVKKSGTVLNHIAVYVTDLDKSGYFYEQILNLQKIEEPFKDGKHIWFTLGAAGQLHLIKGALQKVTPNKNEHLCFSVPSITDFMAGLDREKVPYINWEGTAKAPTVRVDGVKQIYFQDPDGHWLEVNDQQ